jgi:hypothetical protein
MMFIQDEDLKRIGKQILSWVPFFIFWLFLVCLLGFGMSKCIDWFFAKPVTSFIEGPVEQKIIPYAQETIIEPAKKDMQLRSAAETFWSEFKSRTEKQINTRFTYSIYSTQIKDNYGYVTVEACSTDINYDNRACRELNCLFSNKSGEYKFVKVISAK